MRSGYRGETSAARAFFRTRAQIYAETHYGPGVRSFMSLRHRVLVNSIGGLNLPVGSRVLDAGCGPGHLIESLAPLRLALTGVDASPEMIGLAKERSRAARPGIGLSLADVENLPYGDEEFDLVCSSGVIEYLKDDSKVLAEFARVLRPGGYLLISVTNLWSPAGYLDFAVERLKRMAPFRRAFNAFWTRLGHPHLMPRDFRVRKHRPKRFREALSGTNFIVCEDRFFHFLPWPRPLDQFFPRATSRLSINLERLDSTLLRILGEGYVILCTKRR